MLRHARFVIASLFVVLSLGCGGSGVNLHPDGGGAAGAGGTGVDASGAGGIRVTFDAGGFTGNGTGNGGTTTGTGGTGAGGAAGAPMPTGALVFQGTQAALINNGPPCTLEAGATGDRWCAFFTQLGSYPADLYVVNVTQAAAGVSITCGTTDANCLHLTSSFTQEPSTATTIYHPALFGGDTLVYYDATWTPYAWRPGMTAGRALAVADPTTMDIQFCTPSRKGTAVYCIHPLPMAMQTDPTHTFLVDLLAGHVDDAATPPLARVDTVIAASSSDGTVVSHFEVDFPVPGTDAFAWSARASATGAEVLKMQTLGNDQSRVTVATGVNGWRVSPEGARWNWVSGISESTGAGTLQSAPYPGGTSPTPIATNAVQYDYPMVPSGASLVVLDTTKNLRVFPDQVGTPTTATSLDTGVIGMIALTPQGQIAYAKATATSGSFASMFVKKSDGTGACTLTSATDGYYPALFFTGDSGATTWLQRSGSSVLARYTRLSDCTVMTSNSSAGLVWSQPLGNRGVLFIDGYNSTSGTGALRYLGVGAGNTLSTDPLAMISGQVGFFAVTASAGTDIVVYTVNGGGNDDGVYVRGFGP